MMTRMDVTLLGTGASDGWPNAWCRCDSCEDHRRRGLSRSNTSALVDGRLALDFGPDAARQASRFGLALDGVRAVLITHAHDDHCHPSYLMHRGWVSEEPLVVAGPPPVIEASRPWLAPDQQVVRFVTLTAGDVADIAGYRVAALPAHHHAYGEALLYAVTDGRRSLLYATDTGPWLPETRALLEGWVFDAVLLEETFGTIPRKVPEHHNLESFAAALDDLRSWGNATPATRCVAIHLGHDNPPLAELESTLAAVGAQVHLDGTTLTL